MLSSTNIITNEIIQKLDERYTYIPNCYRYIDFHDYTTI